MRKETEINKCMSKAVWFYDPEMCSFCKLTEGNVESNLVENNTQESILLSIFQRSAVRYSDHAL